MKTAIVYASVHHGNTKKIIDEIAKTNDVELIDATQTVEKDLSEYDLIGFASGVYGGKFHQSVLKFASVNLTDNKNVFLICTYGGRPVFKSIEQVIAYKHDNIVGRFSCKGFDTFGPFKLIGGVSKGHPDEKDIAAAVEFYNGLKCSMIAIDTIAVENEVADNMYQRSELDYLIYNDPVAYAELILNGNPEAYLKTVTEYKSLY